MKFSFQKNVACSQMTLPIVGALSVLLWFVLPDSSLHSSFATPDFGVWQYLAPAVAASGWSHEISLALCALAVYMMAELNNANMLLRVSSRMLSSMFALLLTVSLNCHHLQPGLVLMVLSTMSLFPLLASYRQPYPQHVFTTFVIISLASLFFPLMIWAAVIYWVLTGIMRAFTPRCFIASLLAILLPYWLSAAFAFHFDFMSQLLQHLRMMVTFSIADYSSVSIGPASLALLTVLLFVSGSVDFIVNRLLDRTRTRTALNAVITHGCFFIVFMALMPQYIAVLQPVLLIDTAIMFGHFFTLTHTRFSHIYMIAMLLLSIATIMLQCGALALI